MYYKKGVAMFCDLNFMKTAELRYTQTYHAVPYLRTMFN